MANIHSEYPYYDNYDASKNYIQQLAIPGRGAQATEFTRLGSMFLDFIKRLGDTLMRDGNIVEGCSISVSDRSVSIAKGKIYIGGIVRNVDAVNLRITGSGSEVIGCRVIESIVTEEDDPTLKDPASGFENYGQPGVHMVKEDVEWAVNSTNHVTVFRFLDGALVTTTEDTTELDVINDILARRTYDESGNYVVTGLTLADKGISSANTIDVTLTSGKAYIRGYEVLKPTDATFKVNKSTTTRSVIGEPKTYLSSSRTYVLNNYPAKIINRLVGAVQVTEVVTRGAIGGGIDYLPNTSVRDVVSIVQGGTTYVRGTDWQLVNDGIDWSPLGEEPSIGTSYTVTYQYMKTMQENTDYKLVSDDRQSIIQLTGATLPINGTEMQIDYDFYLARKDLVLLDKDGNIGVYEGTPDILRLVSSPLYTDRSVLQIGTVTVYPNSSKIALVNNATKNMTMESLQRVVDRLDQMEYNQAITDLDNEAQAGESATELQGILTDGFIGFSKCDMAHKDFSAGIDISREELTLPAISSIQDAIIDSSSVDSNYSTIGTVISAPFISVEALSQPYATEVMLVNPYQVFDRMLPVKLNPSVDNWIDENVIVVYDTSVTTTTLRRWWYHQGESWAASERAKWEKLGFTMADQSGWDEKSSTATTEATKVVLDEAVQYMRQRYVEVTAQNFVGLTDNIKGYFDDREVALIPLSPSTSGTTAGTIKASVDGTAHCKFMIPEKVLCGTKEFRIEAGNASGTAQYSAQGRHREIQKTIIKETIIVKPTDPLAQTFQFDKNITLTELDLYFAAKDNHPVNVQIRNVVNGYPGTTLYGEQTLMPKDIAVSAKADVATTVKFENPILIEKDTQYCFVVQTDSSVASLWVCNLGDKDVTTEQYVTTQPYVGGVLFSSSNGLTWTAHQSMDIKFKLYRAQYTGKGAIVFNSINVKQADRIMLAIDAMSPVDTGILWYFSINDGAWTNIDLWDDRDTSVIAYKVSLKAEMTPKDSTSPMIASNTLQLVSFLNELTGAYVSRNVVLTEGFNTIRVLANVCIPTGTTVAFYYATDTSGNTWNLLTDPVVTQVDAEFNQYEFTKSLSTTANAYRVKIELVTNNPLARPRIKKLMNILKTL